MRATSETTVADQEGDDKFCSKYDTVSQSKKVRKVAMKEGLVFSTGAAGGGSMLRSVGGGLRVRSIIICSKLVGEQGSITAKMVIYGQEL